MRLPLIAIIAADLLWSAVPAAAQAAVPARYRPAPASVTCHALGKLIIRPVVDSVSLGGAETELAEITFPPGWDSTGAGHRHGRPEILYVLDGRLGHVVNDTLHEIPAGGVGIVRPGDRVRHQVLSDGPVRVLAVWAPGGELARILASARPSRCPDPPKPNRP
jgi:quercetin dioxygenase-like cupin family protein